MIKLDIQHKTGPSACEAAFRTNGKVDRSYLPDDARLH